MIKKIINNFRKSRLPTDIRTEEIKSVEDEFKKGIKSIEDEFTEKFKSAGDDQIREIDRVEKELLKQIEDDGKRQREKISQWYETH